MSHFNLPKRLLILAAIAAQIITFSARADYLQTSGSNYYQLTSNWSGNTINDTFSATLTGNLIVALGAGRTTTGNLTFTQGGPFNLLITGSSTTNETITLGGNVVVNMNTGQTVSVGETGHTINFVLNGQRTFEVDNSDILNVNNAIDNTASATDSLTKTGSGLLELQLGSNRFAAGFTLKAGTVEEFTTQGASAIISGLLDSGPLGKGLVTFGDASNRTTAVTIESNSGTAKLQMNQLNIAGDVIFGQTTVNTGPLNFDTTKQTADSTRDAITLGGSAGTARSLTTNVKTTLMGVLTDGGVGVGITKSGTATLVIGSTNTTGAVVDTDVNTYTGTTTVNTGTLELNKAANTVAVGGNLVIGDGVGLGNSDVVKLDAAGQIITTATVSINGSTGELNLSGDNQTIAAIMDTGTVLSGSSSIVLGGATLTVGNSANTTFSGIITGAGAVVKQGTGTLTLGLSNTYTSSTTINAGILAAGVLANGGVVSSIGAGSSGAGNLVINSGTLQYTGAGATSNRQFTMGVNGATIDAEGSGALVLSSTGAITVSTAGARTLTLTGTNTAGNKLTAPLGDSTGGGATSVVKNGTGTWILGPGFGGTLASTYTGPTTVNAGTLIISGTVLDTATVSVSGTLGGGGILGTIAAAGATTVNSGGAIAPGVALSGSAGAKFTINNDVTFNDGSKFIVNLDDVNSKADVLTINGNLTLLGTDALTVNLISGLPADGSFHTYEIASYTGSLIDGAGSFFSADGYQVDTTSTPGEVLLTIPEPGVSGLLLPGLAGMGFLAVLRRSRRRRIATA